MFCKNCGTQLKDEAAFCHKCGTAVTMPKTEPAPAQVENTAPAAKPAEDTGAKVMFGTPEVNAAENTQPIYQMPQYTAPVEEPEKNNSGFAIASLVLGISSTLLWCCCINVITSILGIIFGIMGLKSSKKGMATAGLILSIIGIVLYIGYIVLSFVTGFTESFAEEFYSLYDYNMYY